MSLFTSRASTALGKCDKCLYLSSSFTKPSIRLPISRSSSSSSSTSSSSSQSQPQPQPQSSASSSTSASQSTKDPSHPYLYYHPIPHPSPGKIALSFLPNPPIQNSRTILGHLPLNAGGGLSDFKENKGFRDILNGSIKEGLRLGKGEVADFEAQGRGGDGYIHITDERAIPPAGRIGENEDLMGSVYVENGKIASDTYEAFPSYRIITSNGPPILPRGLDQHLIEDLEKIDKQEKSSR